jgi:mannosylglucosylglycerate synthase
MNIALCHFRIGETDGVSLEMEKWKLILEKMGHKVCYLAGSPGNTEAFIIPEMHYKHPENLKFIENAFVKLEDYSEDDFKKAILDFADSAEKNLSKFVEDNKIDMLMPNNILSRGWNIPLAIAFCRVIEKYNLKCVAHHHDFYWERDKFEYAVSNFATECLDKHFPPNNSSIKHVVINEIARKELKRRKGVDATVVPNVFDYSVPSWGIDEYNKDFRKAIGIKENDILVLQATRIVERKAIELAIDVVGEMQKNANIKKLYNNKLYDDRTFTEDNEIVFVLAGLHEFSSEYIKFLKIRGKEKNVKMLFVNDIIEDVRCTKQGKKCYSLWDAFANSDLVTYPSIYEGWGNQFLETVFAKKPVVVYEYPVYITDIKKSDFDIISLGSEYSVGDNNLVYVDDDILKSAAEQSVKILIDNVRRTDAVEKNFQIAKKSFSYDSLAKLLKALIK